MDNTAAAAQATMGNHSSSSSYSSRHLNASSADAPPAHAPAVHSAAARRSASLSEPLTHTQAATTATDEQSSSRTSLGDSVVTLASTPASAASSLSGRKRAAEGPALAALASASAAPVTDPPAQSAITPWHSKKQRLESAASSSNGDTSASVTGANAAQPAAPSTSATSAASAAALSSTVLALSNRTRYLISYALQIRLLHLSGYSLSVALDARQALHGSDLSNAIKQLGRLANAFVFHDSKQTSSPTNLWQWLYFVDHLFTELACALPLLDPQPSHCRALLSGAMCSGSLQLIPELIRRLGSFPLFVTGGNPLLTHYCLSAKEHAVSLLPYLRLFEFGLDPTETTRGGHAVSALQLARNHVRANSSSAPTTVDAAAMQAAYGAQSAQPIPSVLLARATQGGVQVHHRAVLHAQFMHALLPAWRAHSVKVVAVLSSPSVLLPELAAIVGRYLDLEGLPPDPVATAQVDAKNQQ